MIRIGDKIPEFKLFDEENVERGIYEFIGRSFMVIYFYPKDFTPGCTREACSFRDNYEFFGKLVFFYLKQPLIMLCSWTNHNDQIIYCISLFNLVLGYFF